MTTIATPIIDKNGKHTTVHRKTVTAPSRSVVVTPALVITDPWATERDDALELLEELGSEIVVSNHGAFPHLRRTLTLNDMSDGDIARGNCWAIVNELIEFNAHHYLGDYVDELSISTKAGLSHTALFVSKGDLRFVVDYTARQFDQSLDYPLILSVPEWKAAIEKSYGQPFEYIAADSDDDDDEYEDEYDDNDEQ